MFKSTDIICELNITNFTDLRLVLESDCFLFQQVNIPMNRRSLSRLIDIMDKDGDGEIDFG